MNEFDRLRAALRIALIRVAGPDSHLPENVAAVLLPIVDLIAKERAADEIRAIAHRLDDGGDEAIEVALGGAHYVHRVLCDCAHALDGKP